MVGRLACPICRTRPPRRACGNRVFASAHCPVCLETCEPVVALPCGHALCEGCFGRIPGGALLVDGQSVGAAPRPAEDARASEAQDRDARRQRREEAARDREDAAARREAVERSRREAAEERERQREAAAARAEEVQCVICQETIRGGDQRLPCAHVFHRACLARWLPEHRSCPVCRTPVSAAEQSAPASARPMERGRDDPNAALYARLQAQHEEHNRDAARDEAARREAARAREAAAERARRDEAARRERARAAFNLENELTTNQWSAGKPGGGDESFAANPWRFNADHTFVTERDGCHGTWFVRGEERSLRMDWQGGCRGQYAVFLRRPGFPPTCDNVGSSMEFMRSWSLTLRGGGAAATTAQPGHSSPPSHAFPDARSFAGCFCTIFPCIPFAPLACEHIITHDSNSYQSKGVVILMFGYIPIPFCWDDHLARKHGNTFEVTTGCCQGTTDTWTSADGFHTSSSCCPAFRCG